LPKIISFEDQFINKKRRCGRATIRS